MGKKIYLLELQARAWPRYFRSGAPDALGTRYVSRGATPITGGVTYLLTGKARRSATANGRLFIGVIYYNSALTVDSVSYYAASSVTPGASWTTYSATFGAATANAIPAAAVAMRVRLVLNNVSTLGTHDIKEVFIANNAAPTVALTADPQTRDLNAWIMDTVGTAATVLTEIDATSQSLPLRYSTDAYVTAAADTPALTPYEARVINPGLVRSEIPAQLVGAITSTFGEIVLSNADGALAEWMYYGLSGVSVSVYSGDQAAARSTFTEVLRATVDQAVVDLGAVRLRLRGPDSMLDRPLLPNRYAGNNALPAGLEGVAADLLGRPKPRIYGTVKHIVPPCVNTARLIYQVHDCVAARAPFFADEGIQINEVRVRGLALTAGADYTDQTDMETNAPAAGQYRTWPGGGYFRLGTTPAGQVVCDAERTIGAPVADPRFSGLMLVELASDAGITDIVTDTEDTAGAGYLGLWVDDMTTFAQALHTLTMSDGAWYGFAHWAGLPGAQFEMGMQIYPRSSGMPYEWAEFDESSILKLQGVAPPIVGRGTPSWRVDLSWMPNANASTTDIDSTVTAAARAALTAPVQRVQASAAATLDMHPFALTLVRETVLQDSVANVQAEADRWLNLVKRAKPCFEVLVSLQAAADQAVKPRLGGLVRLRHPSLFANDLVSNGGAFDYFEGYVLAIEMNLAKETIRMTVYKSPDDL